MTTTAIEQSLEKYPTLWGSSVYNRVHDAVLNKDRREIQAMMDEVNEAEAGGWYVHSPGKDGEYVGAKFQGFFTLDMVMHQFSLLLSSPKQTCWGLFQFNDGVAIEVIECE